MGDDAVFLALLSTLTIAGPASPTDAAEAADAVRGRRVLPCESMEASTSIIDLSVGGKKERRMRRMEWRIVSNCDA